MIDTIDPYEDIDLGKTQYGFEETQDRVIKNGDRIERRYRNFDGSLTRVLEDNNFIKVYDSRRSEPDIFVKKDHRYPTDRLMTQFLLPKRYIDDDERLERSYANIKKLQPPPIFREADKFGRLYTSSSLQSTQQPPRRDPLYESGPAVFEPDEYYGRLDVAHDGIRIPEPLDDELNKRIEARINAKLDDKQRFNSLRRRNMKKVWYI